MAYMDHNGMVRQGDYPVSTSPSVNGASTWSPWAGERPGAYEEGFEARNYPPRFNQPSGGQQQPIGPVPPSLYQPLSPQQPLTPPTMPTTVPPPQQSGGTGGGAGSGGNIGTYQTGIKSGQISNASIGAGRDALKAPMQMPGGATGPISAEQQGSMQQQYDDIMRQGTQAADMGFSRDSAYQQAQQELAFQKALAGAAAGGFGNLIGLDAQNTAFNTGNRAADISQRGIQQSALLRVLQGVI